MEIHHCYRVGILSNMFAGIIFLYIGYYGFTGKKQKIIKKKKVNYTRKVKYYFIKKELYKQKQLLEESEELKKVFF
jgi:hypothetical protein